MQAAGGGDHGDEHHRRLGAGPAVVPGDLRPTVYFQAPRKPRRFDTMEGRRDFGYLVYSAYKTFIEPI